LKDTLAHISNRVPARLADNALKVSATFWFLTAVIGLWIFVIYIVGYYAVPILHGGAEAWTNTRLPGGENAYVLGDLIGNMAVVMHLAIAIAVIIMGFGPCSLSR
jgi:hypothetical protein